MPKCLEITVRHTSVMTERNLFQAIAIILAVEIGKGINRGHHHQSEDSSEHHQRTPSLEIHSYENKTDICVRAKSE
jgi:hypothetical protein